MTFELVFHFFVFLLINLPNNEKLEAKENKFMNIHDLVPVLQLSIGPVIVISGVGLLLLSITNRYGRVIDRARTLADLFRKEGPDDNRNLKSQIGILIHRAHLLRLSIILASLTLLQAALLIITLFFISLFQFEISGLIIVLFVGCMLTLIASITVFILDLNLSLKALYFETDFPTNAA
jgi:hypothetical protein